MLFSAGSNDIFAFNVTGLLFIVIFIRLIWSILTNSYNASYASPILLLRVSGLKCLLANILILLVWLLFCSISLKHLKHKPYCTKIFLNSEIYLLNSIGSLIFLDIQDMEPVFSR